MSAPARVAAAAPAMPATDADVPCRECDRIHGHICPWLRDLLDRGLIQRQNYSRYERRAPHYDLIRLDVNPSISLDKWGRKRNVQGLCRREIYEHSLRSYPLHSQRTVALDVAWYPRSHIVSSTLRSRHHPVLVDRLHQPHRIQHAPLQPPAMPTIQPYIPTPADGADPVVLTPWGYQDGHFVLMDQATYTHYLVNQPTWARWYQRFAGLIESDSAGPSQGNF